MSTVMLVNKGFVSFIRRCIIEQIWIQQFRTLPLFLIGVLLYSFQRAFPRGGGFINSFDVGIIICMTLYMKEALFFVIGFSRSHHCLVMMVMMVSVSHCGGLFCLHGSMDRFAWWSCNVQASLLKELGVKDDTSQDGRSIYWKCPQHQTRKVPPRRIMLEKAITRSKDVVSLAASTANSLRRATRRQSPTQYRSFSTCLPTSANHATSCVLAQRIRTGSSAVSLKRRIHHVSPVTISSRAISSSPPSTSVRTTNGLTVTFVDELTAITHTDDMDTWTADSVRPYYERQVPVILRGAVAHYPAVELWKSLDYWQQIMIVPGTTAQVEMGGSYGAQDAETPEIPFHSYVQYLRLFQEQYGNQGPAEDPWLVTTSSSESQSTTTPLPDPSKDDLVYMAQNDLLKPLYEDIIIPAFCRDPKWQVGHGKLYSVMSWLGPKGVTSPLHHDPLDNCYLNLVGRKRFVLFNPQEDAYTQWHHAGTNGQQHNTSPIELEAPTVLQQYPDLAESAPPALYALLQPGDLLFIPSRWWHHVRSLDFSASVNVWFR